MSKGDAARDRGFTLITVLWTVSILTLIASVFIAASRSHVRVTSNALANAEAEALAETGIHLALLDLVDAMRAPADRQFVLSGATTCRLAGRGTLTITIADEGGKLDLNFAEAAQFQRLFEGLGYASDDARRFADVIADYRDADDKRRPSGAERDDYLAAGSSIGPANGPFVAIEELGRLPGFPPPLVGQLLSLTTVHSGSGDVHLATAPAEVANSLAGVAGTQSGNSDPSGRNTYTVSVTARTERGAEASSAAIVRLKPGGRPLYAIERWIRRGAPGRIGGAPADGEAETGPC